MSAFSVKAKHAFLIQNNAEVKCGSFAAVLILVKVPTVIEVQMLIPENVTVGLYSFPNLHSDNFQNI